MVGLAKKTIRTSIALCEHTIFRHWRQKTAIGIHEKYRANYLFCLPAQKKKQNII